MEKRLTMFLACLLFGMGMTFAQNKITGTVFEDTGEPCIGATVMVQGTKQGTKTDFEEACDKLCRYENPDSEGQ